MVSRYYEVDRVREELARQVESLSSEVRAFRLKEAHWNFMQREVTSLKALRPIADELKRKNAELEDEVARLRGAESLAQPLEAELVELRSIISQSQTKAVEFETEHLARVFLQQQLAEARAQLEALQNLIPLIDQPSPGTTMDFDDFSSCPPTARDPTSPPNPIPHNPHHDNEGVLACVWA